MSANAYLRVHCRCLLITYRIQRYNLNPSQQGLVAGIRLAQMWNVPCLFRYSLDHFKRQFHAGNIHPAIVLAIARENGIPSLVKPTVEALAEPAMTLSSWCSEVDVLRYLQVEEVSAIARMKERLYLARLAILDIPPVVHASDCNEANKCVIIWTNYWHTKVGKRIRKLEDGAVSNQLCFIRSDIIRAEVPGIRQPCLDKTIDVVGKYSCWYADRQIIDGTIAYLMVTERIPDWCGSSSNDDNPIATTMIT